MSLCSKIEIDVEVKVDAAAFHEFFTCRPHHVSNATPGNIQACNLHDGEWGKVGSVINWNYVHDGKAKTAKEIIEAIDDVNNSTTFKVVGGDLMEEFETFIFTLQATPKKDGGSLVHWTLDYELKHDQVPHPETLVDFFISISKEIDGHLVEAAPSTAKC